MKVYINNIPTYSFVSKKWTTTSFDTQEEFATFLLNNCFKEPGEYEFDKNVFEFNRLGERFTKVGNYTDYAPGTPEYNEFWDNEKLKCRLGVIWKNEDLNKIWYTTRDYYFLINFCPIKNKEKGIESFMTVRDVQYHMMMYEKIAEAMHKHSVCLKKRQMAFSVCHTAKCLNFLWFENKNTIKIFASNEGYLNSVNGCWKMIDGYRNHLNQFTDWERIFSPTEYPELKQIEKVQKPGSKQWITIGNESTLNAKPIGKDVAKSVGGAGDFYWWEEGGVAKMADEALMYIDPALEVSSTERSGSFCIGGSVGDLEQCKPLQDFMEKPSIYNFLPTKSKWINEDGLETEAGLFIPTQYGMPEAVDEFGNSLVEKGLEILAKLEIEWQKLPADKYAIKKSQNPKTMAEAFAWRKAAFFNTQRIERRQKTITLLKEEDNWEEKRGLLEINNKGEIVLKPLSSFHDHNRPTPMEYPVKAEQVDKRGCVTIYEEPDDDLQVGTYFAGVDSVEVGISTTSNSLFSIYIYKRGCRIIKSKSDGTKEISYERGKLVASYNGRFDNPKDHNEQGLLLLRKYKALAACERNRPNFINYCRDKGFSYLIARKSELPFDKDLDATGTRNDEYGVYSGNDGKLLHRIKQALYEYVDSEIDTIHKITSDGTIGETVKTIRGYDLVNDYWLLQELKLYNDDGNFDRTIAAGLAIILGVSRELDHEKTIYEEDKEEKKKKPTYIQKPMNLLSSGGRKFKNLLRR